MTVTYCNGSIETYSSVVSAAVSVGVSFRTLRRMSDGCARLGIASVSIESAPAAKPSGEPRRRRAIRAGDVPADVVELIYRYARRYVAMYGGLPAADREDAVQFAAIRVSEDEANGLYASYADRYTHRKWLWLRVRRYAAMSLRRAVARLEASDEFTGDCGEFCSASHGLDERIMLDEMPAELRPLAECLLEGRSMEEARGVLGMSGERAWEVARKLGEWLRRRARGE